MSTTTNILHFRLAKIANLFYSLKVSFASGASRADSQIYTSTVFPKIWRHKADTLKNWTTSFCFFIQMKDHPSEFNFSSEGIRSDQLKLKILHISRAKQFKL